MLLPTVQVVPYLVSHEAGKIVTFYSNPDKSIYASEFGGGSTTLVKGGSFTVETIDVALWFHEHLKPTDHIHVRMDIEGSEYTVIRRMITSGVACWMDVLEFETHAMYHVSNYNKRPVDVVVPWLLRECGVDVVWENWYEDPAHSDPLVVANWPAGDTCRSCELLKHVIPEDV